jgi:hypothetical protein
MEPDQDGANLLSPPLPFPPPLPPPLSPQRQFPLGSTTLWRWNERLALVVGGLTVLLLGVLASRVLGPAPSELAAGFQPSTTSLVAPNPGHLDVAQSAEEVNPPESVVRREVITRAVVAPEPAEETAVAPVVIASSPPPPAEAKATSEPLAQPEPTNPVSEESAEQPIVSPAFVSLPLQASGERRIASIIPPASTTFCEPAKEFKDRKLSTALTWSESVDEAAAQAEEEEKLVFLIHVSGNFESLGFT